MNHVSRLLKERRQNFPRNRVNVKPASKDKDTEERIKPKDYSKFFIISLGTGQAQKEAYDANKVLKWRALDWMYPLLDFFLEGSSAMVDHGVESDFNGMDDDMSKFYFRIQKTDLDKEAAKLDNISKTNLQKLENIGKGLLTDGVKKVDLETGNFDYYTNAEDRATNMEALSWFARLLVKQRNNVENNKKQSIQSTV